MAKCSTSRHANSACSRSPVAREASGQQGPAGRSSVRLGRGGQPQCDRGLCPPPCARSSNRPASTSSPCAGSATTLRNLRKRENPDIQRSLFGEILDWMLAPLLFVWPISIAFDALLRQQCRQLPVRPVAARTRGGDLAPGQLCRWAAATGAAWPGRGFPALGRDRQRLLPPARSRRQADRRRPGAAGAEEPGQNSCGEHGEVLFRDDEYRGQTDAYCLHPSA
jgi:hypothetical protein